MREVAEHYCHDLAVRAEHPTTIELCAEMMGLTADIVLKTLFSTANPAGVAKMYRIMVDAQNYIVLWTTRPVRAPFSYLNGRHRRFKKDMAWFDQHLFDMMDKRRKETDPPADLLTMLLQSRYEDTGETMSDQQVRDEAITLFAAGHETSSNALSWTPLSAVPTPGHHAKIESRSR